MQRFRLAKKGRRTRVTLAIPGRGDSRSRDTGTCQGVMYLGKKVNGFMRLDLTVHRRSRGDVQLEGCAARYMPSEEVELVLWADGDFHNRGERNDTIRFVFQNRLSLAPVGRMTERWEGVLAISSCLFRCWQTVGKVLAVGGS